MMFARITPALLSAAILLTAQTKVPRGFSTSTGAQELEIETKARAVPEAARMAKYMEFVAGEPHQAGSPRSKAVAEYIQGMLKEWGLETQIEQFDVLLPYPTVRRVEVLAPKRYEA